MADSQLLLLVCAEDRDEAISAVEEALEPEIHGIFNSFRVADGVSDSGLPPVARIANISFETFENLLQACRSEIERRVKQTTDEWQHMTVGEALLSSETDKSALSEALG